MTRIQSPQLPKYFKQLPTFLYRILLVLLPASPETLELVHEVE
jgi:hypothetical protein